MEEMLFLMLKHQTNRSLPIWYWPSGRCHIVNCHNVNLVVTPTQKIQNLQYDNDMNVSSVYPFLRSYFVF